MIYTYIFYHSQLTAQQSARGAEHKVRKKTCTKNQGRGHVGRGGGGFGLFSTALLTLSFSSFNLLFLHSGKNGKDKGHTPNDFAP